VSPPAPQQSDIGAETNGLLPLTPPALVPLPETNTAAANTLVTAPSKSFLPETATETAAVTEDRTPAPCPAKAPPAKKKRAVRAKGAIIVGQDGSTVRFRKKCTVCGFEDTSCKRIPIRDGLMRENFFCPTCRKRRDVEIHGTGK
jgi:hypothetical protein